MSGITGKKIRLGRMLNRETGRALCLAFDHGMQLGPISGFEEPAKVIEQALEAGIDGIILTPGLMAKFGGQFAYRTAPTVILRLDQTSMWRSPAQLGYEQGLNRLIATVEEAVALGADAVITYLFVGHSDPAIEARNFEDCAAVARECRRLGILHVVETMVSRHRPAASIYDPEHIAMHTRIGAELGADILKTDWSGDRDSFARIVHSAQAPILVAGGPQLDQGDSAVLALVADVVASGAAGILFGRNIVQSQSPLRMLRALRAIIHDGASVEQAVELLAAKH